MFSPIPVQVLLIAAAAAVVVVTKETMTPSTADNYSLLVYPFSSTIAPCSSGGVRGRTMKMLSIFIAITILYLYLYRSAHQLHSVSHRCSKFQFLLLLVSNSENYLSVKRFKQLTHTQREMERRIRKKKTTTTTLFPSLKSYRRLFLHRMFTE